MDPAVKLTLMWRFSECFGLMHILCIPVCESTLCCCVVSVRGLDLSVLSLKLKLDFTEMMTILFCWAAANMLAIKT